MTRTGLLTALLSLSVMTPVQAESMSAHPIETLIAGNTVYLELDAAPAPAEAAIYFSRYGRAAFRTPSGPVWNGNWRVTGNALCVSWQEPPRVSCIRHETDDETMLIVDAAANGSRQGRIVRVRPHNPEGLVGED